MLSHLPPEPWLPLDADLSHLPVASTPPRSAELLHLPPASRFPLAAVLWHLPPAPPLPLVADLSHLPAAPSLRVAEVSPDLRPAARLVGGQYFLLALLFLPVLPHVHPTQERIRAQGAMAPV